MPESRVAVDPVDNTVKVASYDDLIKQISDIQQTNSDLQTRIASLESRVSALETAQNR
jgi:cell division septum initiation protein DivIVA